MKGYFAIAAVIFVVAIAVVYVLVLRNRILSFNAAKQRYLEGGTKAEAYSEAFHQSLQSCDFAQDPWCKTKKLFTVDTSSIAGMF